MPQSAIFEATLLPTIPSAVTELQFLIYPNDFYKNQEIYQSPISLEHLQTKLYYFPSNKIQLPYLIRHSNFSNPTKLSQNQFLMHQITL